MTSTLPDFHFSQQRQLWSNAGFSEVNVLRASGAYLAFTDIDQHDRYVKLSQVAYLRSLKAAMRGEIHPRILTFSRLEVDCRAAACFPDVDPYTDAGELLYSANSLITYTLRELLSRGWLVFHKDEWHAAVPANRPARSRRAQAVLALLVGQRRLFVGGMLGQRIAAAGEFDGFDVRRDLVPVDRLGFIREFVWRHQPRAAFNASYFLLEHDDYFSHHSGLGEAYNLYVRDGTILRPPLYRRAAFVEMADGRRSAATLSLADLIIKLSDGTRLVPEGSGLPGVSFALNPLDDAGIAIYTRTCGLRNNGGPLRKTPARPGRVEYTVVDTRIVGRKEGGDLDIPQNGFVLSVAPGALGSKIVPEDTLPRMAFEFASESHRGIQHAIQAGPMLIRQGKRVISAHSLADEEFSPTPLGKSGSADIGVVPTDYPDDVDRTRAGRIGLGVGAAGELILVAVPGTEKGTYRSDVDSAGATLLELAQLLEGAGAVDAINFDGGGSTQLFYRGGLATTPGNRFGTPGIQFERMVPSIGVLP
jgi:hypothetical protein